MAPGGDDDVLIGNLAARVEQQSRDLLAQALVAINAAVGEAVQVLPAAQARKRTQQGFERRAADIRAATAQLDHVAAAGRQADQFEHLIPLRHVHRPLRRATDHRQCRLCASERDEIAGLRPRRGQAPVFQLAVGLLHRAQADAVFEAEGAHRGQALARAVQALFDARAELLGQVDVEGHDSCPGFLALARKAVQMPHKTAIQGFESAICM
ncbi:hypothetical protein D3C84_371650 [compost metagenome]